MVTIRDVAEKAGVSATTVSRVLNNNGYVSKKVRHKVELAMSDLKYQPNVLARGLVTKKVKTIGLIVPSIETPFFASVTRGVEEVTRSTGYGLLYTHSGDNYEGEMSCLRLLEANQVGGILIVPASQRTDHLRESMENGMPLVVIARKIPQFGALTVAVDNIGGSYRVMRHLLGLGHIHMGVINGKMDTSTGLERWLGARQALQEAGHEPPLDLVLEGDFGLESGYVITKELLKKGHCITAIYAANDMMAIGAVRALKELNIAVPRGISVAAFHFENQGLTTLVEPPLTGNIHPSYGMGKIAAELLIQQIEQTSQTSHKLQEVYLQMEFVVRESCGPVPK